MWHRILEAVLDHRCAQGSAATINNDSIGKGAACSVNAFTPIQLYRTVCIRVSRCSWKCYFGLVLMMQWELKPRNLLSQVWRRVHWKPKPYNVRSASNQNSDAMFRNASSDWICIIVILHCTFIPNSCDEKQLYKLKLLESRNSLYTKTNVVIYYRGTSQSLWQGSSCQDGKTPAVRIGFK